MKCYCNTITAIEPKGQQVSVARAASGLSVFRACFSCAWTQGSGLRLQAQPSARKHQGSETDKSGVCLQVVVFDTCTAANTQHGTSAHAVHSGARAFAPWSSAGALLHITATDLTSAPSHPFPSQDLPHSPPADRGQQPLKKNAHRFITQQSDTEQKEWSPWIISQRIPWSSPLEVPYLAMAHQVARKEERVCVAQLSAVSRKSNHSPFLKELQISSWSQPRAIRPQHGAFDVFIGNRHKHDVFSKQHYFYGVRATRTILWCKQSICSPAGFTYSKRKDSVGNLNPAWI